MKKSVFSMFGSWVLSILLVLFLIGPVDAARYEDLTVGKLTVEKSAAIQGILQAAANTTGKVFYVHSGTGINAIGRGTDATKPFASVDFAIGQTRANKGDFIIVMPGHAESFAAANGFDADVAGVTIVGLGNGADRPTFTYTGTAGDVAIGAASVTIANLRFKPGISDVVRAISVEAAGDQFTMLGCEFSVPGTATFEFLDAIIVASGADDGTYKYNTYRDGSSSAANTWLNLDAGIVVNPKIIGNDIYGRFAVAPIHSSRADTGVLLADNFIGNTIAGQFAVEFTAAATGLAVNNRFYSDAAATTFDPGSLECMGNLMVNGIDSGGVPVPIAGTEQAVPTADAATNVYARDVIGNKTDAAATVGADKTIMANVKQVTNQGQKIDSAAMATSPTAGSFITYLPRSVEKSDGAVLTGNDNLFVIAGGPVRAKIVGYVSTIIGGASNGDLQIVTTSPAGTTTLNAAPVAIDNDAAGTLYYNVGATSVFTPLTAGAAILDPVTVEETEFLLPPGTVHFRSSAAQTGVIKWYMTYRPLSPNSLVTAAP